MAETTKAATIRLYNSGKKPAEIAKDLNVTVARIYPILSRYRKVKLAKSAVKARTPPIAYHEKPVANVVVQKPATKMSSLIMIKGSPADIALLLKDL